MVDEVLASLTFVSNTFKMNKLSILLLFLLFVKIGFAQLCNSAGNLIIFSNYDGSRATATARLNIVIDQNIPNIRIGICSYERVTVNITGAFVGNVTAVRYAGFNAMGNCNCGVTAGCANTSVITGVPAGIITYSVYPPATTSDPNGNSNMICAYQCTSGNQGGCNTASQVVSYFSSVLGGTFRSHTVQYGCWNGATFNFSNAGNCCLMTPLPTELSHFDVSLDENDRSHLEWTTESEINTDYFLAQKSSDLENWITIDQLDGQGNSTTQHFYETWDELIGNDVMYYRLKSVDFDGSEYISDLRSIALSDKLNAISIYPNPTSDMIFANAVISPNEKMTVKVTDLMGKLVKMDEIDPTNGEGMSVADVTNGIYIVTVYNPSNGTTKSTKIMIHHE